jgi:hypothetical protein
MPVRKSSNGVLSPRLFFRTGPPSFSAVGFLLGFTLFLTQQAEFKQRPALSGLPEQFCCKSFAGLRFS